MNKNLEKIVEVVLKKQFPEIVETHVEGVKIFSGNNGKISYAIVDITIDKNLFEKRFNNDEFVNYFEFEEIYNHRSSEVVRLSSGSVGSVKKYFEKIDKAIVDSLKLIVGDLAGNARTYWNIQNVYFV